MDELTWEMKVPIFKNKIIIRQLILAIGIPFGALFVIFVVIRAYNGLILIGVTFVLGFLIMLYVFRGTYDVRYVINKKGVLCQNQNSQRKRVKRLSTATFLLGLLKGNFTAAGTGLLSGAGTDIRITWKRIRKVKFIEKQKTIMISAGFGESLALFCMKENYYEVKQYMQTFFKRS